MTPAEQFFYDHAGYMAKASESLEEGHRRTAILLAYAEAWARRKGIRFDWADDWAGDHSYVDQAMFEGYEVTACEVCTAYSRKGNVKASLGCIDDASPEYRRVVEAELAMEVMG